MNKHWKTMLWLIAGCLLLIGITSIPSVSVGEDPPDPPFTETVYQAYRDNATGLEWGKHIDIQSGILYPEMYVADFYYTVDPDPNDDIDLPYHPEFSGGFDDWRPPTVGELLTAIDNGLLEYLYADFSYADGAQVYGNLITEYVDPDLGPNWGDDVYWSICVERYQGLNRRYKFRFTSEMALDYWMQSGSGWHIAVRGAPADHSNCPGKHYKPPKPDRPGRPGKPPK